MVVILDELTPLEFFNHGGIVKLETDEEFQKVYKLKKKYTFFNYKDFIRFLNTTQLSFIHNNPDIPNNETYKLINSHIKLEPSIGTSKYVTDLEYDDASSYEYAKFYYSGEIPNNPDVSHRDPYGIKNVCFSLMEETDTRWDEYAEQRLERGFDDSELWNLDSTITKFILPRLKRFRTTHCGFPAQFKTDDQWCEILDKMIKAFEIANTDSIDWKDGDENLLDEGFKLFIEYYLNLWD